MCSSGDGRWPLENAVPILIAVGLVAVVALLILHFGVDAIKILTRIRVWITRKVGPTFAQSLVFLLLMDFLMVPHVFEGPAQAQNLWDSLADAGSNIVVKVWVRKGSRSFAEARTAGFLEANGTLGDIWGTGSSSDLLSRLISDAAQVWVRKGSRSFAEACTAGFLEANGTLGDIWGTGSSSDLLSRLISDAAQVWVRKGSRSFAEARTAGFLEANGTLGDIWGTGSSSDLLSRLISDAAQVWVRKGSRSFAEARTAGFLEANGTLGDIWGTGSSSDLLSRLISDAAQVWVRKGSRSFAEARTAGFLEANGTLGDIWGTGSSSDLLSRLISDAAQEKDGLAFPMGKIDETRMWKVGEQVRATQPAGFMGPLHPFTAGIYMPLMMARIEVLRKKGHSDSEIINEIVIESVDSLNSFMHARGVSFLVDYCSTTARLGSRKWAPRFDYILTQQALVSVDKNAPINQDLLSNFFSDPVHGAIQVCAELRPTVDISVPPRCRFCAPIAVSISQLV